MTLDPRLALPSELFQSILSFLPYTDVVKNCLLVSREWNSVANSGSILWRNLVFWHLILPFLPEDDDIHNALKKDAENTSNVIENLVDEEEKKDDGITSAKEENRVSNRTQREGESDWKIYFVWKAVSSAVRWASHKETDRYHMRVSPDGKVATKTPAEQLHCQAWGTTAFTKGTTTTPPQQPLYVAHNNLNQSKADTDGE